MLDAEASTFEEPGAGIRHAGICAARFGRLAVLPRCRTEKQPMRHTFRWILWPNPDFGGLFDEFYVGSVRLCLLGNSLDLESEGDTKEEAAILAGQIAKKYSTALFRSIGSLSRLVSMDEFASMPAQAINIKGPSKEELRRLTTAIRQARNDLLAFEEEALRRCYDYLQDAKEDEQKSVMLAYKLVETVQHFFGSEQKTCQALGIRNDLKTIKRLANEPSRDERHAPNLRKPVEPLSLDQRVEAVECARRVLRAFEMSLLTRSESRGAG